MRLPANQVLRQHACECGNSNDSIVCRWSMPGRVPKRPPKGPPVTPSFSVDPEGRVPSPCLADFAQDPPSKARTPFLG